MQRYRLGYGTFWRCSVIESTVSTPSLAHSCSQRSLQMIDVSLTVSCIGTISITHRMPIININGRGTWLRRDSFGWIPIVWCPDTINTLNKRVNISDIRTGVPILHSLGTNRSPEMQCRPLPRHIQTNAWHTCEVQGSSIRNHMALWLPARWAFGFFCDHQHNLQWVSIHRCCVLIHVWYSLFSVGNKVYYYYYYSWTWFGENHAYCSWNTLLSLVSKIGLDPRDSP